MIKNPPKELAIAIALAAGALLILEIVLSRIFSVLFYYHYSFFAVGLVMSGLTLGGLWAGRWRVAQWSELQTLDTLSRLAVGAGIGQVVSLGILIALMPPTDDFSAPRIRFVILAAIAFLPALALTGTFLTVLLARRKEWIGRLYAADLAGAAVGCLGAVMLMRVMPGPVCVVVSALFMTLIPLFLLPSGRAQALRLGPLLLILAVLGVHAASGSRLIRLRSNEDPFLEKWNEHSRLWVKYDGGEAIEILIDRGAGTFLPVVGQRDTRVPLRAAPAWTKLLSSFPYRMERPIEQSAIIGVGGGRDLLPPLALGAKHVDGFEINGNMVRLLTHDLKDFYNVADWPEVSLMHSEGRIGLRHRGTKYDSIQASQIDTWAATASGGFVLSENGLYTIEAWRLFLSRLSARGFLSMTRWYLPDAPAETHRLVALAVEALRDAGIKNPQEHIVLAVHASREYLAERANQVGVLCTIVVSISPFTSDEIARYKAACDESGWQLMIPDAHGMQDRVIEALLDPARFDSALMDHDFDIRPPTDDKPFFFLMLRPSQIFSFPDTSAPAVVENTMNAVRVMLAMLGLSLVFSVGVLLLANRWFPRAQISGASLVSYRWLTLYFTGIGAGYMFVQLAFHQRLILALGQPTYSLSVILFSMLLGGGIGSALSGKLVTRKAKLAALAFIPILLAVLWITAPLFSRLEEIPSAFVRVSISGAVVGLTGMILGLAFPIGASAAAGLGDWTVQRMWAVNGATSILGSSSAAIIGMMLGGRAMFVVGMGFYLLTLVAAVGGLRESFSQTSEDSPSDTPQAS